MCLIVFAWRPGHPLPLLVAANRDEFHARPTRPLAAWDDAPGVFAGRDLEAGGTWLGIGPGGRFAALTNIRDPRQAPGRRSRGDLPARFLAGRLKPRAFLVALAAEADDYGGFNLLLGDAHELWHFNARSGRILRVPAGVHALSNADLDTPWPKVVKTREALAATLADVHPDTLMALLGDRTTAADCALPETGVGLASERMLSSVFIAGAHYGTRASTVLIVHRDGRWTLHERCFGPGGARQGDVLIEA